MVEEEFEGEAEPERISIATGLLAAPYLEKQADRIMKQYPCLLYTSIYYSREALEPIHKDIETFAEAEHLTAHANSIRVRFE